MKADLDRSSSRKGQQATATAEEAAERAETLSTQGRKGCKAHRINMAFSSPNFEFIKVMAAASGHNMTEFTNLILDAYRAEHPELMEQANAFLATVNSGLFSKGGN